MAYWMYYKLNGHTPVPCTIEEMMEQFESDRVVRQTYVGDVMVSTVFLSINHAHSMSGPPILFETMVFGGPDNIDQQQARYETWEQAEAGHASMVALVQVITGDGVVREVVEHGARVEEADQNP